METNRTASSAKELIRQGIEVFRSGDKPGAVAYFEQATQLDPHNQNAWLWLAGATEDVTATCQYLERVVTLNPDNSQGQRAREALRQLQPAAPAPEPPPVAPAPAPPEPEFDAGGGETIREGRWDCTFCGTVGVLGRHHTCPNCGRTRPEDTHFYLPEDAPEVTDPEQLRQAMLGPDWVCNYCDTGNSAGNEQCRQCGAPREADSGVYVVTTESLAKAPPEPAAPAPEPLAPGIMKALRFARPSRILLLSIFLVPVLTLGASAVGILFNTIVNSYTTERAVTVEGFSWERTVDIEEYRTLTEEDWSVPSGGRVLSQNQEIHHYDDVLEGYETRTREVTERVQVGTETYTCGRTSEGNGYYRDRECTRPRYENRTRTETYEDPVYRQEPVYRTRYTYEIDRWVPDRTAEAADDDHDPHWPDFTLDDKERESGRDETYVVHTTDNKDRDYDIEVQEAVWEELDEGDTQMLEFNLLGEPMGFVETESESATTSE